MTRHGPPSNGTDSTRSNLRLRSGLAIGRTPESSSSSISLPSAPYNSSEPILATPSLNALLASSGSSRVALRERPVTSDSYPSDGSAFNTSYTRRNAVPAPSHGTTTAYKKDSMGLWVPPSPNHGSSDVYNAQADSAEAEEDDGRHEPVHAQPVFSYRPIRTIHTDQPNHLDPVQTLPSPANPQREAIMAKRSAIDLTGSNSDGGLASSTGSKINLQNSRGNPTSDHTPATVSSFAGSPSTGAVSSKRRNEVVYQDAPNHTREDDRSHKPLLASTLPATTNKEKHNISETMRGTKVGNAVITEDSILRDILRAWCGADRGVHIRWHEDGQLYRFIDHCPNIRYTSYLQKLQSCAYLCRAISDIVNDTQHVTASVLLQSMYGAISECLMQYRTAVNVVLKETHISIHDVMQLYRRYYVQLDALNDLVLSTSQVRGDALISRIMKATNTAARSVQPLMLYIAQETIRPWFAQLKMWITEGVLQDPYQEFFVELDSSIVDTSEMFWQHKYKLRPNLSFSEHEPLPATVTTLSPKLTQDVLVIGKTINFVCALTGKAESCVPRVLIDQIMSLPIEADWKGTIQRVLEEVNIVQYRVLTTRFHLHSHFRVLNSYVMLSRGDFVQQLLFKTLPIVHQGRDLNTQRNLSNCLAAVLRELPLVHESDATIHDMLDLHPATETGQAPFVLSYTPYGLLNNIFDRATLSMYYTMNRFLMRLAHTDWALKEAWRELVEADRTLISLPRDCSLHALLADTHLLWHGCHHFVQSLQSYVVHSALESSWADFSSKLVARAFLSLDELRSLHSEYLTQVLKNSLQLAEGEHTEVPRRVIDEMLNIIHSFCNFHQRVHMLATRRRGDETALAAQAKRMVSQFRESSTRLLVMLERGALMELDRLHSLVLQLNYNNYYSMVSSGSVGSTSSISASAPTM